VKSLIILAGALSLASGSVLVSASAPHHQRAGQTPTFEMGGISTVFGASVPAMGHVVMQPASDPAQAASTQTVVTTPVGSGTATPGVIQTPTPAPTVTATTNPFPDANSILASTFAVYQLLKSVHYEQITDGEQLSIEKVHLDARGYVTCKNLAINGRITGSDTLEGTSQTTKIDFLYTQIKKAVYLRQKKANSRWIKGKPADLSQFGITVDNFLFCSSATTSSGTPSSVIKDLTNLGPASFQGIPMWHIHATQVSVDATGKTSEATLDFLISQDHFLPYVYTVTVNDTTNKVTLVEKQILTQFGKKVTIKAPKIGSQKP
jgi:hypothetical protein